MGKELKKTIEKISGQYNYIFKNIDINMETSNDDNFIIEKTIIDDNVIYEVKGYNYKFTSLYDIAESILNSVDRSFIFSNLSDRELALIFKTLNDLNYMNKENKINKLSDCNHFYHPQIFLSEENDRDYHKSRIDIKCLCLACGNMLLTLPDDYDMNNLIGYANILTIDYSPFDRITKMKEDYGVLLSNESLEMNEIVNNLKENYETNTVRRRK